MVPVLGWIRLALVIFAGASSLAAESATAQTPPRGGSLDCGTLVAKGESGASLRKRYGRDAKVEDLPGAEGETSPGIVLYPGDPTRRVVVRFADEPDPKKLSRAATVEIADTERSLWRIAGLTVGSGLAEVTKANGGPFMISGFEWDYGGFVTDWRSGALAAARPGGCSIVVRFSPGPNSPAGLSGDKKIPSSNAALVRSRPKVTAISLNL